MPRRWPLVPLVLLLATSAAAAQSSTEERLREALRQTTIQLRSLQDSQAALTAERDQLKQQTDSLKQQLEAAKNAKPPPDPELPKLRAAAAALQQENSVLQAGLKTWQAAYQQAATIARDKTAESRRFSQEVRQTGSKLKACTGANAKLIAEAYNILHLYRTQSFRALLLGSYEPLLGFKKVELENLVQDYEDKIEDQRLYPAATTQTQTTGTGKTH